MKKLFGVYCTDEVARDGSRLAISALDDMLWMGSDGGRPLGVSHDRHRFIGWNMLTGLYISHERRYVVGNSFIPDNKEEYRELSERRNLYWKGYVLDALGKTKDAFQVELSSAGLLDKVGKWHYNGLALYGYDDILFRAFPMLMDAYKDGMIALDDLLKYFIYQGQGVFASRKNKFAVVLHPYFRRSQSVFNNFNFGFIDKLLEVYNSGNHSVKVALDTSFIGYAPSYIPCHEYEYWYGPKYNDHIDEIKEGVCKYKTDLIDKVYNNIDFTEFVWQKKDDGEKYQFEMEEVMDSEVPTMGEDLYACRYLHALYDFERKEFNHFDGAIRSYTFEQILNRLDLPMDQVGHTAKYTKIFRVDGHIGLDVWKSLITQYLCSNRSVYEYFGVPVPVPKPKQTEKRPSLQDYVPYILRKGDGVRLCVSYGDTISSQKGWSFCNFDVIEFEDGVYDVIEFPTVDVAKALKREGVLIDIPEDKTLVVVEDYCNNIPTIFHGDGADLEQRIKTTLRGLMLLVGQHVKNGDKDIYSFSLSWNIDGRSVLLAFMGHVCDLYDWLSTIICIPIERDGFKKWLDAQNSYIHSHGRDLSNPIHDTHIQSDGVLSFLRRPVRKDVSIKSVKKDGVVGYTATIDVPEEKKYIAELLEANQLQFAMAMQVLSAKEIGTNEDYIHSAKSGTFKECQYIIEPKIIGFFWATESRPISLQ